MSGNRRYLIPVDIIVLVFFSIGLAVSVINGSVGGAIASAVFVLLGVWVLIRRRAPDGQGSGDPAQIGRRKFVRGMLGYAIVGLGFATLFAIEAGQTSGGKQAILAFGAVILYLCAALFIVITILAYKRIPGDATNP